MKSASILSLLLMSSVSFAANFPVGSFVCTKRLDNGTTVNMSTVQVSEVDLQGHSLPIVEIQYENNRYVDRPGMKLKGVASVAEVDGEISLMVTNRGPAKGIAFYRSGQAYDPSYGSLCTKQ